MRLRGESGQSLPELLLAILIGLMITGATVTLLVNATQHNDEVQRRTVALQQGRAAMDAVVRSLRSQVCLPNTGLGTAPIVAAGPTSVTFYADFGDGTTAIEKHTIALDAATGELTDTRWQGSGSPPSFLSAPTTRTLATDLAQSGATPVFRYYAYTSTAPELATVPLVTPLSTDSLTRVAKIAVTLQANPAGRQDGTRQTTLQDDVVVRLTDPDGSPVPTCI